jgi:hypothetical protein
MEIDVRFPGKRTYLFALGRNAMYAACVSAGLEKGDKVLTPAFDCDGSLQPFRVLGLEPVFYRSDPYTFKVDTRDLASKLSCGAGLVHVINHFGFSQEWEDIVAMCRNAGLPVLEDNAYSLFSEYNGSAFGSFGDFSVFSLRKNLPVIDGGMLVVNNDKYQFSQGKKTIPLFYRAEWANVLTLIKSSLGYYKAPEGLRRLMRMANPAVEPPVPLYSEADKGYPDWPLRDHLGEEFTCDYLRPMSALARRQLKGLPGDYFKEVSRAKRAYYSQIASALEGTAGLRLLYPELPQGAVPFCVPLLVESGRDRIFADLRKNYDVMVWPTLPQAVLEGLGGYPDVDMLGRKLLQLNLPAWKVLRKDFLPYVSRLTNELISLAGK